MDGGGIPPPPHPHPQPERSKKSTVLIGLNIWNITKSDFTLMDKPKTRGHVLLWALNTSKCKEGVSACNVRATDTKEWEVTASQWDRLLTLPLLQGNSGCRQRVVEAILLNSVVLYCAVLGKVVWCCTTRACHHVTPVIHSSCSN